MTRWRKTRLGREPGAEAECNECGERVSLGPDAEVKMLWPFLGCSFGGCVALFVSRGPAWIMATILVPGFVVMWLVHNRLPLVRSRAIGAPPNRT